MTTTIEQTECSIPKVFVFNVPPRSSSTGHRAADWPKESLWSGRLRLVTAGDKTAILLEHTDKDGLFARCPVDSKATVEQVTDSSRYFVIKVSDGHGHSAYLGVAFEKREEAFEFKVALQTAQNRSAADKKASDYFSAQPAVDTHLAADASIEVNLTGKFAKKKDAAGADAATGSGAMPLEGKKAGSFAIAPPKASGTKSRRAIAQSHQAGGAAGAAAEGAAAAGSHAPAPAPAKAAKAEAAPAAPKPTSTSLDTDATLLEAFGAAPPASAVAAPAADPMAFFSAGK